MFNKMLPKFYSPEAEGHSAPLPHPPFSLGFLPHQLGGGQLRLQLDKLGGGVTRGASCPRGRRSAATNHPPHHHQKHPKPFAARGVGEALGGGANSVHTGGGPRSEREALCPREKEQAFTVSCAEKAQVVRGEGARLSGPRTAGAPILL